MERDDEGIDVDVSCFIHDPSREFPLEHTSYGCRIGRHATALLDELSSLATGTLRRPLPPSRAARASCHSMPIAEERDSDWQPEPTVDLRPVTEVEDIEDYYEDELDWLMSIEV